MYATDLYQALDGRSLCSSSGTWRIEVYGVFEHKGSYWIQLVLQGASNHSVAVRIDDNTTDVQVIDALGQWFVDPSRPNMSVLHLGEV